MTWDRLCSSRAALKQAGRRRKILVGLEILEAIPQDR